MQCPDCGYFMSDLDAECQRCKRLGKPARGMNATAAPPLPPRAPLPLAPDPTDTNRPRPTSPAGNISVPPPLIDPALIACVVCGNSQAQRVSAVCQKETWTTTTTFGRSNLAQSLLPPPKPYYGESWGLSIIVPLAGSAMALVAFFASGALGATLAVLATTGIWALVLTLDATRNAQGEARCRVGIKRWKAAITVWERLFYCSRCDHVYDPQTREAAQTVATQSLLFAHAPDMTPKPTDVNAGRLAALPLCAAAVALGLIWWTSWNISTQERETAHQIEKIRTPRQARLVAADKQAASALAAGRAASTGETFSLNYDIDDLSQRRDAAKEALDALGRYPDDGVLKSQAAEIDEDLSRLEEARRKVMSDLQTLNQPVVVQPALDATSSLDSSSPSDTGFTMRTEAGGGPPPDPKGFQGAPTTTATLPPN